MLAPENTLAAFRAGAVHGYRMFECDAKLSADGVVFLLHDNTLERTTNGRGVGGEQTWSRLSQLDAGAWHSTGFTGEPLATLDSAARFCQANACWLNIEIKPTPGQEARTGQAVAEAAARLWSGQPGWPPLLSSFQPDALQGALEAAPELPRALLLDTLWNGWLGVANALQCKAVVCNHVLWDEELMANARAAGLRAWAYTVNDTTTARRLLSLGLDGIITDRVDEFAPDL